MRELQPRGEHVLIEPLPSTPRGASVSMKPSPIIVPDIAEEPSRAGRIIAKGPKALDVFVGDTVLFGRYAGVEFKRGEDTPEFVGLRLMKESEILLKIERN